MTEAQRFVRRNRVDERAALAIAALAGLAAVFAGAEPTGSATVDAVLVFASIGAVVWASASAPWWAPTAASGIGAVIAFDPLLALFGAAGFLAGLAVGVRRRHQSEIRAVIGAVAMNVLIRSELDGFLGLSALVGVTIGVALFVLGVRRRPSAIRRIAWITSAAAGGVVVVALAGLAIAGVSARQELSSGATIAREAIATLNTGDYETAAEQFAQASTAFGRADVRLDGPLTVPSRLLPGVAQNVSASSDLAAQVADGSAAAADALATIDPDSLRLVDGAIDLDAVAAVEAPLLEVQDALVDLRAVTDDADSPWLIPRLQDEIVDLDAQLDDNEPRLENAIDAVRLAPQILGADGERRYLILLTTPAEARGLGGFSGNYADVTVDDGRITLEQFGRTGDLNSLASGGTCADCPREYLDRYGRTGLTNGPNGTIGPAAWSNLTFGAHFPHVGATAQVLYPQSGGQPIDGVMVMDPYVVEALMQYTGPIDVPELGVTVEPSNAAEFILRDQYVIAQDKEKRVDALDTLGNAAIEALLAGSLPSPAELAGDLGPLVDERRLLMWTGDPVEQDLLARTGLIGAIPALGDDGGFSVSVNNTGESKIDVFLDRDVQTAIETDPDGTRRLVADVTLTNTAPETGLPPYVIGNNYGLPSGTSRLFVTFYGPPSLLAATRNGEPIDATPGAEGGWIGYGHDETLGPGETVEYRLEFQLEPAAAGTVPAPADAASDDPVDDPARGPVVWWQPLAERRT
jgi:hypothetical protein